jgi:hypothetical protein
MQIVVNVVQPPVAVKDYPGPHGLGFRFIVTEDLELVSIDGNLQPAQTRGGTHSAIVATLRVATANDNFFPANNDLFQYEAIYLFDAGKGNLPAALPRGQITVRGAFWEVPGQPAPPGTTRTFPITGGTGPYAFARGQVTESGANLTVRTLDITL